MMDITNLKLCLTIKKVNSYEMSIIILMLSHILLLSGKLVGQLLSPHSSSKLIKANFLIANVTYFFNAQSDIKPVYFFFFPNTICTPFLRNWKTGSDSAKTVKSPVTGYPWDKKKCPLGRHVHVREVVCVCHWLD